MRRRRSSSSYSRRSWPPRRTTPASGSQKRSSRLATVVLPAPDGPTSATVLPAGTLKRHVGQRAAPAAGIGEAHARHLEGDVAPVPLVRRHARAVGDRHRLGVDRVDAARGAERVGELAADLRDLPHRHEGRHGEQREERQHAAVEPPARREPGAREHDREAAEAGRDLLPRALPRQVAEERQRAPPGRRCALAANSSPRARTRWKATISPSPCTESTTWAFRSPDISRAREPSRSMRARAEDGRERGIERGTAAAPGRAASRRRRA